MAKGVVIGKLLLTPAQQRGLAGTSVIGRRRLTTSERQILAQRFGLGGTTARPSKALSTSEAFFSGQSTAPFQGNIRNVRTGEVVSVTSARGKILLSAHKASQKVTRVVQESIQSIKEKQVLPVAVEKPPVLREQAQKGFETFLQPVGKGFLEFLGTSGELAAQTAAQAIKERERRIAGEIGFFETGKDIFGKARRREAEILVAEARGEFIQEPVERGLRAGGRVLGQVSPIFLPGGAGIAAAGVSALGAERFEEAAFAAGTGIGFGFGFRALPPLARLGKTAKLPSLPKLVKGIKIPAKIAKGVKEIPLVAGTGFIAISEAKPLTESFFKGPEEFRKESRRLAAGLGAFTIGAKAGGLVAGEFLRPLEGPGGLISRRVLVNTGSKKAKIFEERFNRAKQFDKLEAKPRNVNLSEVENLTPKTAKVLKKFLQNPANRTRLGGSAATNAQLPKQIKPRPPGDADLYTSGNEFKAAEKLFKQLKAEGANVRFRINKRGPVETPVIFETVGGKSNKAIEFHNINQLVQNVGEVRGLFEPFESSFVTSPGGIKLLKLSTQAKRKVIGGTFDIKRIRRTGGKDIIDFEQKIAPALQFLQPKPTIAQRIKIVAPTKALKGFPKLSQTGFISLGEFPPGRGGIPGDVTISKPIKGITLKPLKVARPISSAVALRPAKPSLLFTSGIKIRPAKPSISGVLLFDKIKDVVPSSVVIRPQKPLRLKIPSAIKITKQPSIPSGVFIKPPRKATPSGVILRPPKRPPRLGPPSSVILRPPKRPPTKPPSRFPFVDIDEVRKRKRIKKVQAFASFVRKKGKLVKVSKRPLRKNTALALSLFVADNTAARTATIRKISGTPIGPKRSKPSLRKFRNPIRGGIMKAIPNLFIEKSRFAIDKPGENKEITQKGLEALRKGFFKKAKKRKRRDVFGF